MCFKSDDEDDVTKHFLDSVRLPPNMLDPRFHTKQGRPRVQEKKKKKRQNKQNKADVKPKLTK